MTLKVRCPACDKGLRVAEADTGRVAVCPACGTKMDVPAAPLLGQRGHHSESNAAAGPPPAGGPEFQLTDSAAAAPAALEALGRRRGRSLWLAAGGVFAVAAVCVAMLLAGGGLRPFSNWEDEDRARLVELKRQAEGLAAAGRLQDARDRYLQMDAVIDGRPIRDEGLRELVRAAHAERQRVFEVLLEERMASAQARPPAAAEAQAPAPHPVRAAAEAPQPQPSPSPQPNTVPSAAPEPAKLPAPAAPPVVVAAAPTTVAAAPTTAPVRRRRPPLQPVADAEEVLSDEEIGRSIRRGVDWLLKQFDPKTHLLHRDKVVMGGDGATVAGTNALAVYALLQSGLAINDPRISIRDEGMKARIEALKRVRIRGHPETYARGIRATCLALFNRREDFAALKADAEALRDAHKDGAYSYTSQPMSVSMGGLRLYVYDNSNSQYGLLGVWSAVEAEPRIEVNTDYWRAVEGHWTRTQLEDGQWDYVGGGNDREGGRLSMTSAGLASLFVAHDYLEAPLSSTAPLAARPPDVPPVGREPFSPAVRKGLEWFERGNNAVSIRPGQGFWGYTLYGVERVGLASGFKYFGKNDWYRVLAREAISKQGPDGKWDDGVLTTSYALVFLARGRHPVLMNKLRFDRREQAAHATAPASTAPASTAPATVPTAVPTTAPSTPGTGFWANRPRDTANLARFTGRALERPLNWQVVNLDSEFHDWLDSPILYIASHVPPPFEAGDYEKLRQFIEAGGMIFTHADASSAQFNQWAEQLPSKLSLPYAMSDVSPDHPVHHVTFKTAPQPPLKGISNGSRLLVLHSPTDLSHHWQKREDRPFELGSVKWSAAEKARVLAPFHFGANLFVYAAGKPDPRNRLDTPYVAPARSDPVDVIPVARLEYAGNWDPEPGAWPRYANWFHRQTGTRLEPRAVKLAELKPDPSALPFAHLTGTDAHKFTAEEVAALRRYVEAGGVVFADVCGGGPGFGTSLNQLLPQAFPGVSHGPVPAGHPMLSAGPPGMEDVSRPRVRLFNIDHPGAPGADLNALAAGHGHFVYTTGDAVSGLLGTNTWGILGFEPKYAQSLMKNLIFWTADGQPKPQK